MDKGVLLANMEEQKRLIVESCESGEWKVSKTKGGVDASILYDPASPICKCMGKGQVMATPAELVEFFADFSCMKITDAMFISGEEVEKVDHHTVIYHGRFQCPPLITNRDFCWANSDCLIRDGDAGVSVGWSVEHPECPPESGFVRAQMMSSGYYFKRHDSDPSLSTLYYVVHVDPKGWIPTWVINLVAADQAFNVLRIKEHFEKLRQGAGGSSSSSQPSSEGTAALEQDPASQDADQGKAGK
eukprot:TRINITY_DN4607_c0_g1_i2.p1 TRINITY_DN4607_c0_g1~~TRINITY_DN4607_c0_g1_i2.p1  ORF type:complete len:244 (-),score=62.79 TRINITY_DN4607_c0_g1_i2:121-852(-)